MKIFEEVELFQKWCKIRYRVYFRLYYYALTKEGLTVYV